MITTYIPSFDDVRALLGIGPKELSDATLSLQVYDLQLQGALENLYPALEEVYARLLAKKAENEKTPDDPQTPPLTKNERRVVGLTQVYATYAVAASVAHSLKGVGVKRLTDGKAEFERFADAYADTLASLKAELATLGSRLLDALEEIGESVPAQDPVYFLGTATLGTDPVTGA